MSWLKLADRKQDLFRMLVALQRLRVALMQTSMSLVERFAVRVRIDSQPWPRVRPSAW
jgi:hypothetical protein